MKAFLSGTVLCIFSSSFAAHATASTPVNDGFHYRDQIKLEEALKITRGDPGLKVAVIATGVNYRLPEIAEAIDVVPGGTGIYPNDDYGADTFKGNGDPMDHLDLSIGTSVAALIAGKSYGIAPGVKIIAVKASDQHGGSTGIAIADGIRYAIKRGAKIIHLAFGMTWKSNGNTKRDFCDPIREAGQQGILVVGSAGNTGTEAGEQTLPPGCDAPNLVTAAAVDAAGRLAAFSSWGFERISVAAPGDKVAALTAAGVLSRRSGTTFSSAIAAGVAALVLSHHPEYSPQDLKEALIRGSDFSPDLAGKVASNGLLNAVGALNAKVK